MDPWLHPWELKFLLRKQKMWPCAESTEQCYPQLFEGWAQCLRWYEVDGEEKCGCIRVVGSSTLRGSEQRRGRNELYCLYGDPGALGLLLAPCPHSCLSPWLGCEHKGRSYILLTIASPHLLDLSWQVLANTSHGNRFFK